MSPRASTLSSIEEGTQTGWDHPTSLSSHHNSEGEDGQAVCSQSTYKAQSHQGAYGKPYESPSDSTSDVALTDSEELEDNGEQRSTNTAGAGCAPAFTHTSVQQFLHPYQNFSHGIFGVFNQRAATNAWATFHNPTLVGTLSPAWWSDSSTNVELSEGENSDSNVGARHHVAVKRNVPTSAGFQAIGTSHKSLRPHRRTRTDWDDGFDADDEESDSD